MSHEHEVHVHGVDQYNIRLQENGWNRGTTAANLVKGAKSHDLPDKCMSEIQAKLGSGESWQPHIAKFENSGDQLYRAELA